jgi:3-deoxy-manno-octulosonate cytidylyltransferase (CMP-KDO synthetase)
LKVLGVIPARFASSRFPGKPLALIDGKPMIMRVYEQSLKAASLLEVIVATDDNRIFNTVETSGGKAMMTSAGHRSGTDRCMEVQEKLEKVKKYFDIVVNIQGDEPYIHPSQIDLTVSAFEHNEIQISTLVKRIISSEELFNPNVNKVVMNNRNEALYFSRNPIPFMRQFEKQDWIKYGTFYKHIGIYAFRADILKKITTLDPGWLEEAESLEQLRWLENGFKIHTKLTDFDSISVDTPDDLLKFVNKT